MIHSIRFKRKGISSILIQSFQMIKLINLTEIDSLKNL